MSSRPAKHPVLENAEHLPDHRSSTLSYRQIYRAIESQDDFNEPQLFFLSRLVKRKLRAFDSWVHREELEMRPYAE